MFSPVWEFPQPSLVRLAYPCLQHPGLRRSHKVSRDGSISLARQLHGQVWGNGAEARRFANVAAGLLHRGRVPVYALPSVSLSSSIARTGSKQL